ncbi:MAG: hypothetical protein VCA35_08595 [Roseibacillus sp.]
MIEPSLKALGEMTRQIKELDCAVVDLCERYPATTILRGISGSSLKQVSPKTVV